MDRSLAQRDGADESIRLHDLQLDYVRAQYPDKEALELIHGAVRLSSHVIARDPEQFASQMVGRLLPYRDMSAIERFYRANCRRAREYPGFGRCNRRFIRRERALIRTLDGHSGSCHGRGVELADGRRAVSASEDQTLKVWDLESGRELRTLEGHSVMSMAWR